MTRYLVLESTNTEGDGWLRQTEIEARSATAAIRAFIEGNEQANGLRYVAVPARSWKPVTVKVETKTALKFS